MQGQSESHRDWGGYGSGGVREKPINLDTNTVRFHIDGLRLTM